MKRNLIIIIFILFISLSSNILYCSDWYSPAIKIGINFNRRNYSDRKSIESYQYPPGYLIGVSNDLFLSKKIFISNFLYYKNKTSKMEFIGVTENFYYTYETKYVRFSTSLGIKLFSKSSFFIGFDIGKLMRADMKISKDKNSDPIYSEKITDEISNFDPSILKLLYFVGHLDKLRIIVKL